MRVLLGLALASFSAFAVPPQASEWLQGVPFALPVDAEWGDDLAGLTEAELAALQGVLKNALAMAAKHADPSRSVFNRNGLELPPGQRITIILTGREIPEFNGAPLPPQTASMTAVTAPTADPDSGQPHVYVFLKLGATALNRTAPGGLRADAVGRTAAALGFSLFGTVPLYLPMRMRDLIVGDRGPIFFQREVLVAQTAIAFFQRLLDDPTIAYRDKVPSYWLLTEQRRRLSAGLAQVPVPPESNAVPISTSFAAPGGATFMPAAIGRVVTPLFRRALKIVRDYPPEGVWNNAFSWDPTARAVLARKAIDVLLADIPAASIEAIAPTHGAPLPGRYIWGGTDEIVTVDGSGRSMLFQLMMNLRLCILDAQGGLLSDALARTAAFLGGEIYGNVQRHLALDLREAQAEDPSDAALFHLRGVRQDLRAREAGVAMLERFAAAAEFAELPVAEQRTFTSVRTETNCASALLRAHLAQSN